MGSLYYPRQPTSYTIHVDTNNLYCLVRLQEMLDGDLEWLSQDKCRNMELLLNYADGRIAIFDTKQFDHREDENDRKFLFSRCMWSTRRSLPSGTTTIRLPRRLWSSSLRLLVKSRTICAPTTLAPPARRAKNWSARSSRKNTTSC